VVRLDAVGDGLRDVVAPRQLGAEDGVRPLVLAVDGLADVVQQGAATQDVTSQPTSVASIAASCADSTACMSWFWP